MTTVFITPLQLGCEGFSYSAEVFPIPRAGEEILVTKKVGGRRPYEIEVPMKVTSVTYSLREKSVEVTCE